MRQVPHALLTRPPLASASLHPEGIRPTRLVRLACVKHAASVHPDPGFAKEDINVDVANDVLTITAERKPVENGGEYICRERLFGTFSRSFDVSSVKVDGISVRYENGLLTLTLPKKDSVIPASRHLDIE